MLYYIILLYHIISYYITAGAQDLGGLLPLAAWGDIAQPDDGSRRRDLKQQYIYIYIYICIYDKYVI